MHNLSFRTLGIDAEYGLRETGLDRLAETISELKSEGAAGWNVTMPCKRAMCDFCDELSPEALISRSVNTVRNENGKLFGYSTDGAGFLRTASEFGYPVKAGAITLLGTGGAAISILIACALEGVERIHVFYNRQSSADRIRPLITQLEEYTKKSHVPEITLESLHDATALDSRAQSSDLIVNATSVGMAGTDLENMSPVSNHCRKMEHRADMAQNSNENGNNGELISGLNKQIEALRSQVRSAALEMEVLRAQMEDLKKEASRAVDMERFVIPDDAHMTEINETVSLIEKAILKERKSRKGGRSREEGDAAAPQKIDERITLIVLKLRRKNCTVREIAAHTGLGVGTVHNIIKRYGNDPQMQNLVTGGTQMELTDYLLIRPADND